MKKKIILRGLLGIPLGISLSFVITVLISVSIGDGNFYPVPPGLMEMTGSELSAVVLQSVLSGSMGFGFAVASYIWQIDSWSLAKQTGVYFMVACIVVLPIAYVSHWMDHSLAGIVSYIVIFVVIFVLVWVIQYAVWRSRIRKLNHEVHNRNGEE